jgi:hypothetical protein
VHIYLTEKGRRHEADVLRSADEIDTMLRQRFEGYDLEGFLDLVYAIQTLDQADDEE